MGNWGEIVGEGGRLRLERFGRLDELNAAGTRPRVLSGDPAFFDRWNLFNPGQFWEQVNVSPDFPTTARLIGELYPQSGGQPVDGVIAVDPPGLAAMLKLTGPVSMPRWPVPITSENVVDVTLRQAYEEFPQDQRVAFLGDLAKQVAEAFTRADLGRPGQVTAALGPAASDGHLLVWMARPEEQALMGRLGIDGAVDEVRGDSLLVVNQNLAANKVDSFFQRHIRYDVALDPSSSPATLHGRLEVTMDNGAPASGLSPQVLGPYDDRFEAGENRTYVSVYSPFAGGAATLDGRPVTLENQPDLGRIAQSTTVSIPATSSSTLALDVKGTVNLSADGWYRLDLHHQTSLEPDDVEVSITVPKGWRIAQMQGVQSDGGRRAYARMALERPGHHPRPPRAHGLVGHLGTADDPRLIPPERAPKSARPPPRVLDLPPNRLLASLRSGRGKQPPPPERGTSVTREQMIRRTTVVTVGMIAWLALVAMPAGAQTAVADTGSTTADVGPAPVAVDLTGALNPPVDTGVLVRSEATSTAPMMAVYFGLSLLGLTLGVITARRRLLALKATELATGVVVGRRARTEFWGSGSGPERVAAATVGGRSAVPPER